MKYFRYLSYLSTLSIIFVLIVIILISNNVFKLKEKIYSNYPNIELRKKVFNKVSVMHHFKNDYNIKFLPFSQFEKLNFDKKKIRFNEQYYENQKSKVSISYKKYGTFFINLYNEDLILTDFLGSIYKIKNISNVINDQNNSIAPKNLKSDLATDRVFDSLIFKDKIYISNSIKKDNCTIIKIDFAKLNTSGLNFENLFYSKDCSNLGSVGKMQVYKHRNKIGLLLSTAEGGYDKPGLNIQNNNSILGKILFIPFDRSDYEIFSKGHRVIQGLYADKNDIIATEHGPRGGDEINKILEFGNYGWPIVSLGERYNFNYKNKKVGYLKDHKKNGFNEPIFSFIQGIGISEIIKLPKSFSDFYENHFLIGSLNGRSLYIVKFNDSFEKVLSIEQIFINNRIRDIKYIEKSSIILLALEEKGELGFIKR